MKRYKILWHVLKVTGFSKFIVSFLLFIFLMSGILLWVEPEFISYGDSLWYSFVTSTTIGYGDLTVQTVAGRIVSVFLGLNGLLFFGCLSGIVVSYYTEVSKRYSYATTQDRDKLQNIDNEHD